MVSERRWMEKEREKVVSRKEVVSKREKVERERRKKNG